MSIFKDEKEMEACLEKMNIHQREHFRLLISQLIECYVNDQKHGVVIIGDESPIVAVMAINATDMDAAELLQVADKHLHYRATEDAPPKEMFN